MRRGMWWAVLHACACWVAPGMAQLEPATRTVLDNGLEVILQRDTRTPRVAVVVTYRVGAGHDPQGYAGLAHMAEHMTFRGSEHLEPLQALSLYQEVGGTEANGVTTPTKTFFPVNLPAEQLPLALWIESERMAFVLGAMETEAFEVERDVVLAEQRGHGPAWEAAELIAEVAYPQGHPYRRAATMDQDVGSLELDHVRWFLQTYYGPDNATLAIVGDIDETQAVDLVKRYFGPIARSNVAMPPTGAPPVQYRGQRRIEIAVPYGRPHVALRWTIGCDEPRCHAVASVLASLMRLRLTAVFEAAQAATDVDVWVRPRKHDLELGAELSLTLGVDPDQVTSAIEQEVRDLQERPPVPDVLAAARMSAAVQATDGWAPLIDRAVLLTAHEDLGWEQALPSADSILALIGSVTAQDIHRASRKWVRLAGTPEAGGPTADHAGCPIP